MGVPMTTGQLRANIKDMQIGDYIAWKMNASGINVMDGSISTTEVPIAGLTYSTSLNGVYYWYAVKVAKGLLVSDRVRSHTVSWDTLNNSKLIEGISTTISGVSGIVRSLTGGCAYVDENGNMSLTDKGLGGFPNVNEFDKYILKFPTKLIQTEKTLDDIFHHTTVKTWVQDTPVLSIGANTNRVFRGGSGTATFNQIASTTSNTSTGYRPVFEYDESKL